MRIITISLAALALTACETYSSSPYMASTQNVIDIEDRVGEARVRLGDFSSDPEVNDRPICRLTAPLDVSPGVPVSEYVRQAMLTELHQARVHSSSADTVIEGTLDRLAFSATGTGSWGFTLSLRSNRHPDGYTVSSEHAFSTSFDGHMACTNGINAFAPAVSTLINAAVNHPEFPRLAGAQ
ncbi:hypothetical protein [Glycocaulis sp.]|uniref:hypothetical protein n=1 Tax=Glycocaulis sp. TaxID=1969725 RepID=UPI003D1F9775